MAITDTHGTQTTVIATRSVADAVTNSTTLVTSATAAFVAGDVGRIVTGPTGLVAASYIASRTSATNIDLNVAVGATNSGQTLNITSEFVLADTAAAGTYVLSVDLTALVAGDIAELRAYTKILTGDVAGTLCPYYQAFAGAQPADGGEIAISPPITTALTDTGAIRFTLTQTKGTARAFNWALVKIA